MKGAVFANKDYELIKQTQRFLFSYKETLSKDVFTKGKLNFCITPSWVHIDYETPTDGSKMEINIPCDYSGNRSIEEMKFLIQDFALNAYFNYEREPMDEPKLKLLKLASVLGVNFRTAWVEIKDIEKQIVQQAGKLFDVAEHLIQENEVTSPQDIPGLTQMIQNF